MRLAVPRGAELQRRKGAGEQSSIATCCVTFSAVVFGTWLGQTRISIEVEAERRELRLVAHLLIYRVTRDSCGVVSRYRAVGDGCGRRGEGTVCGGGRRCSLAGKEATRSLSKSHAATVGLPVSSLNRPLRMPGDKGIQELQNSISRCSPLPALLLIDFRAMTSTILYVGFNMRDMPCAAVRRLRQRLTIMPI
jgi:hypothetical protein